jgi:hypothetical protein
VGADLSPGARVTGNVAGSSGARQGSHPRGTAALWPTPDQELLLRAALSRGPATPEAWQAWRSRHDLIETKLDHGSFRLLPLVYKNLVAHRVDDVDLPRLKGIYRYWWCSNQRLLYQAAAIIRSLDQAGVPSLVLKGAATATLHYRDMGVRPMADIDLLVPVEQAAAAVAHLQQVGWRPARPRVADLIRYQHSVTMVREQGEAVDVHWHVFRECIQGDASQGFWRRSVPLQVLDARCRALGPADALLHTVVHGMRWNEEPTLRWIPDAMAILRSAPETTDWKAMNEEARERRLLLRLVRGLDYLRRTFGAPIPDDAFERIRNTRPSKLERLEYRFLTLGSDGGRGLRFGHLPLLIVTYLRLMSRHSPARKIAELPAFLRYRLKNRSEPAIVTLRRLKREIRRVLVERTHGWAR